MKYTKDHEWISVEGNVATIGITKHAADALGELVYVELPSVEDSFKKGDAFIVVESSKSASDVYSPVDGTVIEVNESLESSPEVVNNSSYDSGWLVKMNIEDVSQIDQYMVESEYNEYLKDES